MSPHMTARVRAVLAWARANDWRPADVNLRHDRIFTWTNEVPDPGNRHAPTMRVTLAIGPAGGRIEVQQMMSGAWTRTALVDVGAWQAVLNVLVALYVIPHRHSTAWQLGHRTAQQEARRSAVKPA